MKITIEIDTNYDGADAIAIFNALGQGDTTVGGPITLPTVHTDAPPPPPASESAIAAEAARVTNDVPPPPLVSSPGQVEAGTPATPYVPTTAGPLDSKGTPWDARIHADSKGTNADGQYKRRKGVDVPTYDRIAAELRAVPTPAASPTAPPPPPTSENAGTVSDTPVVTTVPDPVAASVPPPPPIAPAAIPPAPEATGGMSAQDALALCAARNMSFEQNTALATSVGMSGVHELLTAPPEKVQAFVDMLRLTYGPDPV